MLRALLILGLIPLVSACDVPRPASLSCSTFPRSGAEPAAAFAAKSTQGNDTPTWPATHPEDATADMVARTQDQIETAIRAEVARAPRRRSVTFSVITLSAGGQYGAFGAGFLTGWSENRATPRPEFNLVTGVSAGATLAPVAFAGPAFDEDLQGYRGGGQDDVLRLRSVFSWAASASIGDPSPLEARLSQTLDARMMSAIAQGHAEGRRLLVGATNIDTTSGEIFDLGRAASAPNAAPCLREAILASAAIPGLFPPRHINGALYADGGLREHVFLTALEDARRSVEKDGRVDIKVEAYLIVNGALRPPTEAVNDNVLDYTVRSLDTLADEVLRDSIEEAVAFARARPDWRLRGIRAEVPAGTCPRDGQTGIGSFDTCLTTALFDHGRAVGQAIPINWLSEADLLSLAHEL